MQRGLYTPHAAGGNNFSIHELSMTGQEKSSNSHALHASGYVNKRILLRPFSINCSRRKALSFRLPSKIL